MKKYEQGFSLIEVMVSVFLLTFGVLALMATQVRSVASTNEAEIQSIVAQAAETLAEGMQINSSLAKSSSTYERTYTEYLTKKTEIAKNTSSSVNLITGSSIEKAALAKAQLTQFKNTITSQLPNIGKMYYAICLDDGSKGKAVLSGNNDDFQDNCSGKGVTTIKLAWRTAATTDANHAATASAVYSYSLKVAQ